jgi:hypothetical protein
VIHTVLEQKLAAYPENCAEDNENQSGHERFTFLLMNYFETDCTNNKILALP